MNSHGHTYRATTWPLITAPPLLVACSQNTIDPQQAETYEVPMMELGDRIFHDESLSTSGHMCCAAIHPSTGMNGNPPLFTDFTYDDLGVLRNANIAANNDPYYFNMGLCGSQRTDLSTHKDLCSAFKVPTLRNIALTAPYFHNGEFKTLREVVSFYVRRDTNPEEFYPIGSNGLPQKFNDLLSQFAINVNTSEVPYNHHEGDMPALSSDEIDDVVAFLNRLTDDYQH